MVNIMGKKSRWGRTVGVILGIMLIPRLPFLGMLIGYWLGSWFDQAFSRMSFHTNTGNPFGHQSQFPPALMQHLFALSGYLAKSDGKVSENEIQAVSGFMDKIGLSKSEKQQAIGYFNQGKKPGFHLQQCLQQLRLTLIFNHSNRALIVTLITAVGEADKPIPPSKAHLVQQILAVFGQRVYYDSHFQWQQWSHHQQQHYHHSPFKPQQPQQSITWARSVLGVSAQESFDVITKKYRKLLSQYHPDRLHARSNQVDEAAIKRANEKTREIKQAYEIIKQSEKTS